MNFRQKIETEIADELRIQQVYGLPNEDNIKWQTKRLMQLIDNYTNQNGLLNDFTKQNTIAETALFNLYHHYFMQPMGSLWAVNFEDDPMGYFKMTVHTKSFYSTNKPLTLIFSTSVDNDNEITVADYGDIHSQISNQIGTLRYQQIVDKFNLTISDSLNVYYHGLANQLETQLYQILELCRYVYEDNVIIPPVEYTNHHHVCRIKNDIWQ